MPRRKTTLQTQLAALQSLEPAISRLQLTVMEAILRNPPGLTCDEVEALTGLRHQTASARLNELARRGVLTVSDDRRRTRSGRYARVYRVAAGPRPGT